MTTAPIWTYRPDAFDGFAIDICKHGRRIATMPLDESGGLTRNEACDLAREIVAACNAHASR